MFRLYKHIVSIKRLVQTGAKSVMTSTGTTYKGYLTVRSTGNHSIGFDRFSGQHVFNTNIDADIRKGDILVHDSVEYNVNAIAQFEGMNIRYLQALLEKKANG